MHRAKMCVHPSAIAARNGTASKTAASTKLRPLHWKSARQTRNDVRLTLTLQQRSGLHHRHCNNNTKSIELHLHPYIKDWIETLQTTMLDQYKS